MERKLEGSYPIAIFDSGVGGLTVFKHLKNLMPFESTVYLGDTANMPYGNQNKENIIKNTNKNINFLNSFRPKLIVAACGTITSYLPYTEHKNNVIGIIEPSCLEALNQTQNGKIGIICTSSTAKSNAYENTILNLNKSIKVFTQDCPTLAPLIEKNSSNNFSLDIKKAVEIYTKSLVEYNVDTIILGCTHYPIAKNIIQEVVGKNIRLIDSGLATAKFVKNHIESNNLNNSFQNVGNNKFYVTKNANSFVKIANVFLKLDISKNTHEITI